MGLAVNVYRNSGIDCTANGISANHDRLVAVNIPNSPFNPTEDSPGVYIENRTLFGESGYWVAYPLNDDGTPRKGGMFGGNFIYSSDSRFPNEFPIPIHDRFEN